MLIDSIINSYLLAYCGYHLKDSSHVGLVANTYCDYFGSCAYPGVIDVGLRVVKMGRSSVMYEVAFWQGGGSVKVVGGWVDSERIFVGSG